ncbi:uncharacterized protein EI90DRAFT_3031397 [Cantharellus anzutake]|uniref:uncharacterized protein n=1 Tax=Cantharellus anzutake TaxID=1750568 RepID=UPI001906BFBC|nr:uncharacterized protein EI90DRAFT_3112184 [Cantharellus anzutake]XP_038923560.1 uncharacterized protein EI90DRAFT_3031397 [Cantharellus anzutake]KAF8306973.1 hypothetical protein EI90DRAFT_3112184 [Cantharellus anzutake]KAF8343115.1 hypothetical protein EI90DRAFT_3031397 [Cantharellus anzutake]
MLPSSQHVKLILMENGARRSCPELVAHTSCSAPCLRVSEGVSARSYLHHHDEGSVLKWLM